MDREYSYITLGILAHVDAGKTTLSESMMYLTGQIRTLGRVDHKDAFLDTHELELSLIHISAELGYAQELWTLASLHKYIQKHAEEAGYPRLSTVTKPYIQKFLREQDMKPFKIKYYCEKRDPDFESKMHEDVYKRQLYTYDKDGREQTTKVRGGYTKTSTYDKLGRAAGVTPVSYTHLPVKRSCSGTTMEIW